METPSLFFFYHSTTGWFDTYGPCLHDSAFSVTFVILTFFSSVSLYLRTSGKMTEKDKAKDARISCFCDELAASFTVHG